MPNWVDNDLHIKGDESEIKRFKEFAQKDDDLLSFDNFIPYPTIYAGQDALVRQHLAACNNDYAEFIKRYHGENDGYNEGGYEWRIENWGTKWDACEVLLLKEEKKHLFYNFFTAWDTCTPAIKKMSELFPELEFGLKAYESSLGWQFHLIIKNGIISTETTKNYTGKRGG